MLRLRAYEKLQNLVSRGAVKKNGKIYTGNSAALRACGSPSKNYRTDALFNVTDSSDALRLFTMICRREAKDAL